MKYRDRIVGLIRVRGDRILPHPKNFRTHPENQKDALRGALADVGIGDALIVVPADEAQVREVAALKGAERDAWLRSFDASAADVLLLDGHLRAEEIRDQPIPVLVLDLNAREQAEFLALFDPLGDLAGFDREKFLLLAEDFNSTNPAVQALVADLAKVDASGGAGVFGDGGAGSGGGKPPGDPDGREFDEGVADDVDHIECPGCGMKIPRSAA